jgi:hypothetical protein
MGTIVRRTGPQQVRIIVGLDVLAVLGTVTATVISAARNSVADAATQQAFVRIQDVKPNQTTRAFQSGVPARRERASLSEG